MVILLLANQDLTPMLLEERLCLMRIRTDFGKFWKTMEIDNAIFQGLDRFGKGRFFKLIMESFEFLFGKFSDTLKRM